MPRKARTIKKAAVEPKPEPEVEVQEGESKQLSSQVVTSSSSPDVRKEASTSKITVEEEEEKVVETDGEERLDVAASTSPPKGKGRAKDARGQAGQGSGIGEDQTGGEPSTISAEYGQNTSTEKTRLTMEQRREKMNALKKKMAHTTSQNRKDLALDKQARLNNIKDATNSRKLAKAERTLDQMDAEERGEDWERIRNWKYTIEDEERWEEMQAKGEESRDKGIIDANGLAARSYARGLRSFKPDLKSYHKLAEGSAADPSSSSSTSLVRRGGGDGVNGQQIVRKDDVFAGINSLSYGDHRPNDSAIDRVVSHTNMEIDVRKKRSRKRPVEEGGEVTYINEKNQHFNKKIGRHFDQYTQEIRDNFERGTAL